MTCIRYLRYSASPAHLLELGVVYRNDVGTVVNELKSGGRDQEIVWMNVSAGYSGLTGFLEQGLQFFQVAALVTLPAS